jgi:hypothetical protein
MLLDLESGTPMVQLYIAFFFLSLPITNQSFHGAPVLLQKWQRNLAVVTEGAIVLS